MLTLDAYKRGEKMAVVPYNAENLKLLARLMRAEAEGDGKLGMLMVGNTGINRVRSNCLDFKDINSIDEMVFQSPGGFEATQKGYFYQRARERDKKLAKKNIQGKRYDPAANSLWFFRPEGDCPAQWFGQWNSGRYKSHCFFNPQKSECPNAY